MVEFKEELIGYLDTVTFTAVRQKQEMGSWIDHQIPEGTPMREAQKLYRTHRETEDTLLKIVQAADLIRQIASGEMVLSNGQLFQVSTGIDKAQGYIIQGDIENQFERDLSTGIYTDSFEGR